MVVYMRQFEILVSPTDRRRAAKSYLDWFMACSHLWQPEPNHLRLIQQ